MQNSMKHRDEKKPNTTITLKDCSIGYENHVVVRRINAHIPQGKITAIVGGSGSGKSTLLRHLVGLSRPSEGKIFLGDTDIFSLPDKEFRRLRRRMGMLFQDGALLGALSLLDNVSLPLVEHTHLSKAQIEHAAMRTLRLVGLGDFGHFYPSQLSGGMRKRAGLARAIITDPPVLFCDEPTSGLDPITSAQMDTLLLDMKKTFAHMTMVVVSHDLASLERIADHVLVLHDGALAYGGPWQELKNSQDTYIQDFLARKAESLGQEKRDYFEEQDPAVQAALQAWMQE